MISKEKFDLLSKELKDNGLDVNNDQLKDMVSRTTWHQINDYIAWFYDIRFFDCECKYERNYDYKNFKHFDDSLCKCPEDCVCHKPFIIDSNTRVRMNTLFSISLVDYYLKLFFREVLFMFEFEIKKEIINKKDELHEYYENNTWMYDNIKIGNANLNKTINEIIDFDLYNELSYESLIELWTKVIFLETGENIKGKLTHSLKKIRNKTHHNDSLFGLFLVRGKFVNDFSKYYDAIELIIVLLKKCMKDSNKRIFVYMFFNINSYFRKIVKILDGLDDPSIVKRMDAFIYNGGIIEIVNAVKNGINDNTEVKSVYDSLTSEINETFKEIENVEALAAAQKIIDDKEAEERRIKEEAMRVEEEARLAREEARRIEEEAIRAEEEARWAEEDAKEKARWEEEDAKEKARLAEEDAKWEKKEAMREQEYAKARLEHQQEINDLKEAKSKAMQDSNDNPAQEEITEDIESTEKE